MNSLKLVLNILRKTLESRRLGQFLNQVVGETNHDSVNLFVFLLKQNMILDSESA